MPPRPGSCVDGDAALAAFGFVAISSALVYGLVHDMALSADGADYFAKILDNRDFVAYDRTRQHAEFATQWPLVMAVRSGVTDVALLKHVFAFGLYLPHLALLALCAFARRGIGMAMLLFPLASALLVSLPAAFVLVGESHVMALTSWPILFLLLRPRLSRVDSALLVVLLVAYCRMYETAALPAILFAAIALAQLREYPAKDRWPYLATVVGAFATIGFGVYGTLLPASVENRSDFVASIAAPCSHPAFLASLAALLLLGAGMLRPHRWPLAASVATAMVSPVLPLLGIAATGRVVRRENPDAHGAPPPHADGNARVTTFTAAGPGSRHGRRRRNCPAEPRLRLVLGGVARLPRSLPPGAGRHGGLRPGREHATASRPLSLGLDVPAAFGPLV